MLESKVNKDLNNKKEVVEKNWTEISKLKNDLDSLILQDQWFNRKLK